ncbi:MAG TPA: hypothetical protein VHI50_05450 [Micromonosporaceae bacterium]|nr:hypothetical protein [Micromonosporaceae bacterium]
MTDSDAAPVEAAGSARTRPSEQGGRAVEAEESAADDAVRTGHPAVDSAVRALANAADLPLTDQLVEYEAAHRTLQETLQSIDET